MSASRPVPVLAAALLLSAAAPAQWPTDPSANLAVAAKPGEQVVPKLAATSDGGCYVGWFDSAAGKYEVYLQRLDRAGVPQWAAGGIPVSTQPQSTSLVDWDLLADSADNAVLVFTDTRAGADLDVYAYKVSPAGALLWGAGGVTLSANADFEPAPRVCEASDGDLAFVWARIPTGSDGGIMLQRLSPEGLPRFAPGGLTIVSEAGRDPAFCDVQASDAGSVVVSWVRDITTFSSPRHVRAGKWSAAGASQWGVVNVYDAASVPIAHMPGLASDGQGGALLWWHRSDLGGTFQCFVQHLAAGGAEVFAHNGVPVATSAGPSRFDPTLSQPVPGGDLFVFWNQRNALQSQWGIAGQRLSPAGALLWGAGGLVLLPVDGVYEGPPRSAPLGDGALVVVHQEPTGVIGDQRVLALRVDAAGGQPWGGPVELASTLSTKSRLPLALDCTGTAKVAWEDDRHGTPDVYAQSLRADGALGAGDAAFADVGAALAGAHGEPRLSGTGLLCGGTPMSLLLADALENSAAALVVGFSAVNLPFKGGTLVPAADLLLPGLPTGPSGTLTLAATWPTAVLAGLDLWFQAWIVDAAGPMGLAASNGLLGTTN